ncbi:MAG TPA: nucleoside hydrolase, partial [Terriglobia bacterium]|nr:nucleoside hydrolase [Terriglobia bacterium]
MQARGGSQLPGLLFDSDMGRNIDAAIALSMLYGLGRGRVIAASVSNSSLEAAMFCDVLSRFYGSGGSLPIGLAEDGLPLEDSPMLRVPLEMKNPDGQPVFRSGIQTVIDTGEPAVVFRNALLGQQDQQAIAVLAGPATNLARLLALHGARDILKSKVRLLVVAMGSFENGGRVEPRAHSDIPSAKRLFAEWPSPIVAVGVEAGNAAPYPGERLESDLGATPNHPLMAAYRAFREGTAGASIPAQAAIAALYAARSDADYWSLSAPGAISVLDDGRTTFKEAAGGLHRYVIVTPGQKDRIV